MDKKLKAFDILRNKPFIDFHIIETFDNVIDVNNYIKFMYGYMCSSVLTVDEFELLKEVL